MHVSVTICSRIFHIPTFVYITKANIEYHFLSKRASERARERADIKRFLFRDSVSFGKKTKISGARFSWFLLRLDGYMQCSSHLFYTAQFLCGSFRFFFRISLLIFTIRHHRFASLCNVYELVRVNQCICVLVARTSTHTHTHIPNPTCNDAFSPFDRRY